MRIGIVGCGIGGLASAINLSRAGHAVTLMERFAEPRPMGAGLLLQPSGLAALDCMGLGDAARAMGARVDTLDGRSLKGRRVLHLIYEQWRPGAFGLGVHRAALFDILLRGALDAGARILTDCEIVETGGGDTPAPRDSKGRAHGPFDLLIAADGSASRLREQVLPRAHAPLYPWGALWAALPVKDARWDGCLTQRYGGASIMMGVLPVGRAPGAGETRHVAFFWSLRHDTLESWRTDGLDAFKDRVARLWPEAGALIAQANHADLFAHATYRDVAARPWRKGRVLLIGDAAHGTSPQLGQGANLALIDALELACALNERPEAEAALRLYAHRRNTHVRWFQAMSAGLTPVFQSRSRLIGGLRDAFMGPLCQAPLVKRMMLDTLCGVARPPWGAWAPPESAALPAPAAAKRVTEIA
jgi:2-polyprenyl-6-methoxyphenol hydroxylase-like FAD-dependent oxidoreductase